MAKSSSAPPVLHELEAEVMADVWRQETATVREVMERLNEVARKPRAYTTYMTIMARLARKGLLSRRRVGKTHVYRSRLSEQEYRQGRAEHEVDAVVEQYGDLALTHFAKQMATLDPKRRDQLRRMARRG